MARPTDDRERLLAIYLNDHRAGAVAGVALARRLAAHAHTATCRAAAGVIADEIERDRAVLGQIADRLGVRRNGPKAVIAAMAERVGRLKLNGRLLQRSPLSDLTELETLLAGIDAKRSLWVSLAEARMSQLHDFDLVGLVDRAKAQRSHLVPLHRAAAIEAFGHAPSTPRG
jgi:hypothetical protein